MDERRATVSMPPLAEYIGQVKQALEHELATTDQIAEIKQLLSQLPPLPEDEHYVTRMRQLLNSIDPS